MSFLNFISSLTSGHETQSHILLPLSLQFPLLFFLPFPYLVCFGNCMVKRGRAKSLSSPPSRCLKIVSNPKPLFPGLRRSPVLEQSEPAWFCFPWAQNKSGAGIQAMGHSGTSARWISPVGRQPGQRIKQQTGKPGAGRAVHFLGMCVFDLCCHGQCLHLSRGGREAHQPCFPALSVHIYQPQFHVEQGCEELQD